MNAGTKGTKRYKYPTVPKAKKVQIGTQPFGVYLLYLDPDGKPAAVKTRDGRLFSFTGAEPYTRRDGTETNLLCWRGLCLVCGAGFTVKTPPDFDSSKAFGRKHCELHKLTPEQLQGLWTAATGSRP